MVRLLAIQQLQMQITSGFIGKTLEKFPGQPKTERARHILLLFLRTNAFKSKFVHAAPNQVRPAAEIDDTPRKAFIHGHMRLAPERISRIKTGPISPNAFFISQRLNKSLPKGNPAIFDRVMRVHLEVAFAT